MVGGFLPNDINITERVVSYSLIVIAILFLVGYLFIGIREILAIIKNFNFGRAEYCRFGSCGLYQKNFKDNKKECCLNPYIDPLVFTKRKNTGNNKGCSLSMPIIDDKPPADYLSRYLEHIRAFRAGEVWWKIISILFGSVLLIFGMVNFVSILN